MRTWYHSMLEVEGGAEFWTLGRIRGSNKGVLEIRGRLELSEKRMRVESMVRAVW